MRSILFPFQLGTTLPQETEDEDQVLRDSIEQILMTTRGERVCRPEIGSGLMGLVYEPLTPVTVALIREEVKRSIRTQERRVQVQDVLVRTSGNQVQLTVVYKRGFKQGTMSFQIDR